MKALLGKAQALPPLCKGRWHGAAGPEGLRDKSSDLGVTEIPGLEYSDNPPSLLRRQPPLHKGAEAWVVACWTLMRC